MRTIERTRHTLPGSDVFIHFAEPSKVRPTEIYAASGSSFQVFANPDLTGEQVVATLLKEYPAFEAHGWTERSMRICYVGQPCARRLWRIERSESARGGSAHSRPSKGEPNGCD